MKILLIIDFFLLKESNQLRTLDSVIGVELLPKKEKLATLIEELKALQEQISLLGGNEQERNRRLELLRYQLDEIEIAALQDGEEEELLEKKVYYFYYPNHQK